MFLWRRRAILDALSALHARSCRRFVPRSVRIRRPRGGVRAPAVDLDRLRGDGAGGRRRSRRHGGDGRRLERSRRLDVAARGDRCARHGPRRPAGRAPSSSARTTCSSTATATPRRLAITAGPSGTIRLDGPIGAARRRGAGSRSRRRAARARSSQGGPANVTIIAESPDAHEDRVRHGRLAGAHRRGLHVRERAPLRAGRRRVGASTGTSREGRGHRLRPALLVASSSPRPRPRCCSPTTSRSPWSRRPPCRRR